MRFRLRTLLIVLAIGPPLLAHFGRPIAYWLTYGPLITEAITNYDGRSSYGSSWDLPYKTTDGQGSNSVD